MHRVRASRALGFALLGLALAELGARGVRAFRAPAVVQPWGHAWLPRDARNYVPDPECTFKLRPGPPEHSGQGLRERRDYPREHAGRLRVLVLGEAEAYGTQVPFDDAWPRQLEALLREGRATPLEVVNGSVPAHTTVLHLRRLPGLLADFTPDVVLIDTGYTDAVARLRYADFRADHGHMYQPWRAPHVALWRESVLLDGLARRLGHGVERHPSIHAVVQLRERGDMAANFAATTSEPFRANVEALVRGVAASGARPVLLTQATALRRFPGEGAPAAWEAAMREANDAVRRVALSEGVPCIDLAAELDERDGLFVDGRRMNAMGQRARAAVIARELRALGLVEGGE